MRSLPRSALALILAILLALSACCAAAEDEVLARGASGEAVEELQARLMELGYLSGKLDGQFGTLTEEALLAFQAEAGLEETGVADAETLEALMAPDAPEAPEELRAGSSEMVWIPRTGHRYHSNKDCSGMKQPSYVTIEEAVRQGFTPCQKCYS